MDDFSLHWSTKTIPTKTSNGTKNGFRGFPDFSNKVLTRSLQGLYRSRDLFFL